MVGRLLKARDQTVAAAESLTGGSLGLRLSRRAGSVGVLPWLGGVLHGRGETRRPGRFAGDDRGAGRGERGVRPRDGPGGAADLRTPTSRVSLTGVAGPDPHDGKPVGTVCMALASERGRRAPNVPGARRTGTRSGGGPSRPPSTCCGDWRTPRAGGPGPTTGSPKPSDVPGRDRRAGARNEEAAPAVRRGRRPGSGP